MKSFKAGLVAALLGGITVVSPMVHAEAIVFESQTVSSQTWTLRDYFSLNKSGTFSANVSSTFTGNGSNANANTFNISSFQLMLKNAAGTYVSVAAAPDSNLTGSGTKTELWKLSYDKFVAGSDYALQVVGRGTPSKITGGEYSVTVAAVPEPETYAMLLAGLGVLAVFARRRAISESGTQATFAAA